MDETLPDHEAITVPVPAVDVTTEDRFSTFSKGDITHIVIQVTDKRLGEIMDSVGVPYIFNKPWPFWFFLAKMVSKVFFEDENQLEWFNMVRVRTRAFITFTNIRKKETIGDGKLQVVEVDFLKLFWKPAREIIAQHVQRWLEEAPAREIAVAKMDAEEARKNDGQSPD